MMDMPKKKGVSVLAISFGKKPGMASDSKDSEPDPADSKEPSEGEGENLDAEGMLKDELDSALKAKDGSALYDAICAIIEKHK